MTKQNSITLILVKMLTYEQIIKAEPHIHRVLDDEAKIFVSGHFAFTSIHDDESKVLLRHYGHYIWVEILARVHLCSLLLVSIHGKHYLYLMSGLFLPLHAATMTNQKFCFVTTVTIYALRSWQYIPAYVGL